VDAGESLKDFSNFTKILEDLIPELQAFPQLTLWSCGGGSVGDVVSFLASIYHRGINLVHVPSTWLAAVDSAHGGKNALNFNKWKNQLGTFYPATKIYLVEELLKTQNDELALHALAEYWKIALISGSPWARKFIFTEALKPNDPKELCWKYLKSAIIEKYKIVIKDPYEKSGIRRKLNLGHTLGHALELHLNLSHGEAVAWGIAFALHLSLIKKHISKINYQKLYKSLYFLILSHNSIKNPWKHLASEKILETLFADKKRISRNLIDYVFIKDFGRVLVKTIKISDLCLPLYSYEKI
jgi:3-dehydroquinate synthase